MKSLPFFIDDLNGGFMKAEGILRVEGEKLVFEYQKKDAVLEAYKSEIQQEVIPLKDLEMMEFKKGFIHAKLILHVSSPSAFRSLPGDELTERTLKLKRKHRDRAANIASNVNLWLSERKLKQLDDDSEDDS